MNKDHNVGAVACQFQICGEFFDSIPYGSGHINDTYCAVFPSGGHARALYFAAHQLQYLQESRCGHGNIQRVTEHLAAQVADEPDRSRRVLSLIPARTGAPGTWMRTPVIGAPINSLRCPDLRCRRVHRAGVSGGQGVWAIPETARRPARPALHDTIPDFHHTPKRFAALEQAIASDVAGRAIQAKPEIEFALARQSITGVLLNANLPERVTHNDTKFNNVMLDDASGEGICVIDLDTVMPGLVAYDFGDMVRTATSPRKKMSAICPGHHAVPYV